MYDYVKVYHNGVQVFDGGKIPKVENVSDNNYQEILITLNDGEIYKFIGTNLLLVTIKEK